MLIQIKMDLRSLVLFGSYGKILQTKTCDKISKLIFDVHVLKNYITFFPHDLEENDA